MPIRKPFAVMPLPLTSLVGGNARHNRGIEHLALHQYAGMRWQSDGASGLWVRGRFDDTTQAVNFMSLMATNALPGTTIRLRLGMAQAEVDGGSAPYDSGPQNIISPARTEPSGFYHSHLELPSIVNASWWRIDIGGHSGDFSASCLVLGLKREPARFYNRDREMGFEDLGSLEIARNGVVAETSGVVLRTLLFRLQWVSNEEFYSNWAPLMSTKGRRQIVLWVFDPESGPRRQDQTYLGFMARDMFLRGNDFPRDNQMDFQMRAIL